MKFLILFSLVSLTLSNNMVRNWERMKAMESCWGEENTKQYTVDMKRAIAKCGHQDAPELALAPFRSTYSFVNTLLSNANHMENQYTRVMEQMVEMMQGNQYNSPYSSYSRYQDESNSFEKMMNNFYMKQMLQRMMKGDMYETNSPKSFEHRDKNQDFMEMFSRMFGDSMDTGSSSDSSMSQFIDMFRNQRYKRAAASEDGGVSLDLGDRLVEKLNQQRRQEEAKIGNMTCVLKEIGCLDHNNQIDLSAMKEKAQQYTMPSPWFSTKYDSILETCYEISNKLPEQIEEQSVVTGETFGSINLAQVRSFGKCYGESLYKLCMNHDIKNKIESNFGPMEEIMEQTKLTENQLFPLVIQLLHGEEMEYMLGEF